MASDWATSFRKTNSNEIIHRGEGCPKVPAFQGDRRGTIIVAAELILDRYRELKTLARQRLGDDEITKVITVIFEQSFDYLSSNCEKVPLLSLVLDKAYFAFEHKLPLKRLSRPVNERLFISHWRVADKLLSAFLKNPALGGMEADECDRFLYTLVMSFCAFCDVTRTGDKKTPGTFFELVIGHLLSVAFGVKPRKKVEVLTIEDERSTLPTDFIFDLGPKQLKFHVPVKISTRERLSRCGLTSGS